MKEERTLAGGTSRYIENGLFLEIYKTSVKLFSIYSADDENYESYASQYYLDTKK